MELLFGVFTAFGLSASAGLNAYIPLLVIGSLAHYTNLITLRPPWDTLANPWILVLLGVLVIIEFLADKIPAINHVNDGIQTFVRPVAGAVAFAASTGVVSGIHPALALAFGLLIAGGVHIVKSMVVRPVVTATTGGAGNIPVSLAEDIGATALSIFAIVIPLVVGLVLILAIGMLIWWLWGRPEKDATQ